MSTRILEIDFLCGSFDEALEEIYSLSKKKNEHLKGDYKWIVVTDFNGKTISSDKTIDENYILYFGKTKDEYKKLEALEREKWNLSFEEEKLKNIAYVEENLSSSLTENRFKELSEKNELEEIKNYIENKSIYAGKDIICALKITKLLNENKIDDALELVKNENFSGSAFSIIMAFVKNFMGDSINIFNQFYEKAKTV